MSEIVCNTETCCARKEAFSLHAKSLVSVIFIMSLLFSLAYSSEHPKQMKSSLDSPKAEPTVNFVKGIDFKYKTNVDYSGVSEIDVTMQAPVAKEKHVLTCALLGPNARRGYDIIAVDNRHVTGEAAGFVIAGNEALCPVSLAFWKIVTKDNRILKALPAIAIYKGDEVDFGVLKAEHWPQSIEVAIYRHNNKIVGITFANRKGIYSCNFSEAIFHPFQAHITQNQLHFYSKPISIQSQAIEGFYGVAPIKNAKEQWSHPTTAFAEYIQVFDKSRTFRHELGNEQRTEEFSVLFNSRNLSTNAKVAEHADSFITICPSDKEQEKKKAESKSVPWRNNPGNKFSQDYIGRLTFGRIVEPEKHISNWKFNDRFLNILDK